MHVFLFFFFCRSLGGESSKLPERVVDIACEVISRASWLGAQQHIFYWMFLFLMEGVRAAKRSFKFEQKCVLSWICFSFGCVITLSGTACLSVICRLSTPPGKSLLIRQSQGVTFAVYSSKAHDGLLRSSVSSNANRKSCSPKCRWYDFLLWCYTS